MIFIIYFYILFCNQFIPSIVNVGDLFVHVENYLILLNCCIIFYKVYHKLSSNRSSGRFLIAVSSLNQYLCVPAAVSAEYFQGSVGSAHFW